MGALVRSQLTWKTEWQQSSISLQRSCCIESALGAGGNQHVRCCEDLLFYDWNILPFLITGSLFTLCFSPSYCCPSHASRCSSGPTHLCEIRQHVFSDQRSHLSTHSSYICVQRSQVLLEIETYSMELVSFVDFFSASSSCQETDGKFIVLLL